MKNCLPYLILKRPMKPDCPILLHPDLPKYNRPLYTYLGNDLPGPNVHTHHKIRKGDVEQGLEKLI